MRLRGARWRSSKHRCNSVGPLKTTSPHQNIENDSHTMLHVVILRRARRFRKLNMKAVWNRRQTLAGLMLAVALPLLLRRRLRLSRCRTTRVKWLCRSSPRPCWSMTTARWTSFARWAAMWQATPAGLATSAQAVWRHQQVRQHWHAV